MAAPWGDNRYQQYPGRYPPNGPPAQPYDPRMQYPPPAGFYNPAAMPPGPPQFPMPSIPAIPHILKPGGGGAPPQPSPYRGGSRELSGDLFFQAPPSFPSPQMHQPSYPPPLKHTISAPAPPLPRKPDFNQPPIPPRPSQTAPPGSFPTLDLYPQTLHQPPPADSFPPEKISAPANGYPGEQPFRRENDGPVPPAVGPGHEDDELNRALAQSKRDAEARRLREDEEMARAMQESLELQHRRTATPTLPSLHIPSNANGYNSSASYERGSDVTQTTSPASYVPSYPSSSPLAMRQAQSGYFPSPELASSSQAGPSTASSASRPPGRSGQQIFDDEALARSLMEEEEREMRRRQEEEQARRQRDEEQAKRLREEEQARLLREEEQARRLREEEQARRAREEEQARKLRQEEEAQRQQEEEQARMLREEQARKAREEDQAKRMRAQSQSQGKNRLDPSANPVIRGDGTGGSGPAPPQYTEVAAGSSSASPSYPNGASSLPPTSPVSPQSARRDTSPRLPEPGPHAPNPSLYRSISANAVTKADPAADPRAARSHSFTAGSYAANSRPPSSQPSPNPTRSPSRHPLPALQEASEPSGSSSGPAASVVTSSPQPPNDPSPPAPPAPPASVPPVTSTQFIDPQLLLGVSMGFTPPVLSTKLTPMQGPMPNVVALPYGRFPPLHIKARSWRLMLQLMARLSETQVEPSIEAQALVKTAMHLRVVVNFVKVQTIVHDWHVVLYMTIDVPPPADYRYKARNSNDPALLPYSYTLSSTPAPLRENPDGPMSKWYSIPATAQTPFPTLPISFPDLATYLMNALEDSRNAAHDRSSGLNKLAKTVDQLYPNQPTSNDDEEEEEERAGFTERVGRFFGIGNRATRPANDERSNLVTPFYADSFGR